LSTGSTESVDTVKKEACGGKLWIVASFTASLFFTVSCIIRGVMSENFLTTKGILCIASFTTGLAYIVSTKIYRGYTGDQRPLCWSQPDRDEDGNIIEGTTRLRWNIVGVLMLRGILEFSGSLLFLLSLKMALEHSVNQGVCSAMITLAGLMISLMGWYAYDEKLNYVQFIGITAVLVAVIMMGFFTETMTSEDISVDDASSASAGIVMKISLFGASAAFCFSFEAILIKWLV